jgi:hypothetical protein
MFLNAPQRIAVMVVITGILEKDIANSYPMTSWKNEEDYGSAKYLHQRIVCCEKN